jgi:phospholipid-binding lipoprotein MlaA
MLAAVLGGCATPPTDPADRAIFEQNNDPLEPLNRKIFTFNLALDHAVFRPIAKTYVFIVPDDGRSAVHNVLDNLKEPTVFFDNLLQGEFKRAGITLGRFALNSTVGIAGLFDVAAKSGIERQPADFGQTLYVWGIQSGPYLILPVFGPSNVRDAIGQGVDSYADPFTIWANDHGITELTTARLLAGGVDDRAQVLDILDDLEKNSVDFYAQLRSMAQQNRAAELNHGTAPSTAPNLYNDPGSPPAAPAPTAPVPAAPAAAKPSAVLDPSRQIASRLDAELNHGATPSTTPNVYNDPGSPPAALVPTAPVPAAPSAAKPSAVLDPSKQIASHINTNLFGTR